MSDKIENIIKDLIKKGSYQRQSDLVTALKKQGLVVKQSTVSRALQRLGAMKRADASGAVAYRLFNPALRQGRLDNTSLVQDVAYNEAMIMVQTRSGSAGHVAQFLDEQEISEIMGTIAGDNSILVIPESVNHIKTIVKKIKKLFDQ